MLSFHQHFVPFPGKAGGGVMNRVTIVSHEEGCAKARVGISITEYMEFMNDKWFIVEI